MVAFRGVGDDFKAGGITLALAPGAIADVLRRPLARPGWDLYLTSFSLRSTAAAGPVIPCLLRHNGRDLIDFPVIGSLAGGEIPLPFIRLEAVGEIVVTVTNPAGGASDFTAGLRGRYVFGRGVR